MTRKSGLLLIASALLAGMTVAGIMLNVKITGIAGAFGTVTALGLFIDNVVRGKK